MIASLKPWGWVFLGIWLILWGVKRFMSIKNPIYEGIMAVLAIFAGILFLLPS